MAKKQRELTELLLADYHLDPGSIEYLIELALEAGSDGPVGLACRILRTGTLSEAQRLNVADFIKRASRASQMLRRFQRSTRNLGRCPAHERRWLQEHLDTPTPAPERHPQPRAASSTEVVLDDGSWSFDQFPGLLDRLCAVAPGRDFVRIRLGDFTYASALAVLAQWLLRHDAVGRHFINCPPDMARYLERIGFSAALRNPEIRINPDFMDWAVGLTRISKGLATEVVTEKLVDIIDTFVTPGREEKQALHILIGEVSGAGELHPRALPEPYVSLSAHTAPIIQPTANGFAPLTGSSRYRLTCTRDRMTRPLRSAAFRRLHRYYGSLRPCAPHRDVPSHGDRPLESFPSHRDDRFPRSTREPGSGSRRLRAGHHPSSQQGAPWARPGPTILPGFDVGEILFDTSSAVHLRSPS